MPAIYAWSIPNFVAIGLILGGLFYIAGHPLPRHLRLPLLSLVAAAMLFLCGDLGTRFARNADSYAAALAVLYSGIALVMPSYWVLTSNFCASHGLERRASVRRFHWIAGFGMVVMWLCAVTNYWHGAFMTAHLGARNDYGVVWHIFAGTGYAGGFSSVALLVALSLRTKSGRVRRQSNLLIAAVLSMLASNLLYIGLPFAWPMDPTVIGVAVSGLLFTMGLYHEHLFSLSPLAFEELLDQDTDGVLIVDEDGALIQANPAARSLICPPELLPRSDTFERLSERLVPREESSSGWGGSALAARVASCADGAELETVAGDAHFRVVSSPLRDRRGRPAGQLLRIRDETAVHDLLQATVDQASLLRTILVATDEGLLVHVGREIRLVNDQFFEIWQIPEALRSETARDPVLAACTGVVEDPEPLREIEERLRADPSVRFHDDLPLRDGRILESSGLPLTRDGDVVGRVWRVRDVTEARQSEEALRHSQKLESLGVMAAGIAHDFNNLLVSVLGNAKLLGEELAAHSPASDSPAADSPAAELLREVESAAVQGSDLTRQLLAYAGKGRVELSEVDASELARDAVALALVSVPKSIEIDCQLDSELLGVLGDAVQLRQMLLNLVLNAADAIGDARGRVTVSTRSEELGPRDGAGFRGTDEWRPGRYVALRVEDTGCGIDADHLERIFDPFFTTKFAGRGLGLAATLGVVRKHRGYIRVESVPGRGTEFTVLLPARRAAAAPEPEAEPPASRERLTGKALVADDEPGVLRLAARILSRAGLQVLSARDGREAVKIYTREADVDVVVLDVTMPEMSGVEAYRKICEIDPEVRVVFSSGHPEQELDAALRRSSSVKFVQKPYPPTVLVEAVRALLGRS